MLHRVIIILASSVQKVSVSLTLVKISEISQFNENYLKTFYAVRNIAKHMKHLKILVLVMKE